MTRLVLDVIKLGHTVVWWEVLLPHSEKHPPVQALVESVVFPVWSWMDVLYNHTNVEMTCVCVCVCYVFPVALTLSELPITSHFYSKKTFIFSPGDTFVATFLPFIVVFFLLLFSFSVCSEVKQILTPVLPRGEARY